MSETAQKLHAICRGHGVELAVDSNLMAVAKIGDGSLLKDLLALVEAYGPAVATVVPVITADIAAGNYLAAITLIVSTLASVSKPTPAPAPCACTGRELIEGDGSVREQGGSHAHAEQCPVCEGSGKYGFGRGAEPGICHGCSGRGWVAIGDDGPGPAQVYVFPPAPILPPAYAMPPWWQQPYMPPYTVTWNTAIHGPGSGEPQSCSGSYSLGSSS